MELELDAAANVLRSSFSVIPPTLMFSSLIFMNSFVNLSWWNVI